MTVDIEAIAHVQRRGDIWFGGSDTPVSYPSMAHPLLARVEETSFWFDHRNNLILALVGQYGAGNLFLDIGGGRGFVSRALQEAGIPVVLVEPDEGASRLAHARGIDHVICGTFQDTNFNAEVADAIGMFDVIEHVDDSVGFLRSARLLLKPGGHLFATVPAQRWLWSTDDDYAGHFRRYTKATLAAELTEAGFVIDFLSFAFSFLVIPIFLFRALPSRMGLRSADHDKSASEHRPGRLARKIVDRLCAAEVALIRIGRPVKTGTSLIVVARNPSHSSRSSSRSR